MTNILDYSFHYLNTSNYFIGFMMILLNLGSRYFVQEVGSSIDYFLNIKLIRRLLIFTVFFTTTRDFKTSIILTACFIIIILELFNEKSDYCIIPKSVLDFMVTNKDGSVAKTEIERSFNILKKAGYIKDIPKI